MNKATKQRDLFVVRLPNQQELCTRTQQPVQPTTNVVGSTLSKSVTWPLWQTSVPIDEQARTLRQLALMLRTGVSMLEALELAASQAQSTRLQTALRHMAQLIQQGRSLSEAMREQNLFSSTTLSLVACGEASGELGTLLVKASSSLELQFQQKRAIKSALRMPVFVLTCAIGVMYYLNVSLVPKIAKFLLGRGKVLPTTTQMMFDISAWVQSYGLWVIALLVMAIITLLISYRTPKGRLSVDKGLLRLPVINGVLLSACAAELTASLATLLKAGMPLLDALKVCQGVLPNRHIAQQLNHASTHILGGQSFANSLSGVALPSLLPQLIRVGERSGALDHVLEELARHYQSDLQERLAKLMAMVGPLMTIFVGGIVGFTYLAMIQGIASVAL